MRVLIVEDEPIIALGLQTMVLDLGHRPVGPAASIADALLLIEHRRVEVAILDIILADGDGSELAMQLEARNIPVMVLTGQSPAALARLPKDIPVVYKPFGQADLEAGLNKLSAMVDERRGALRPDQPGQGQRGFSPPT